MLSLGIKSNGKTTMQIAMIQDEIVPLDKVQPAYLDRGTFFGDGVYEVVRSYDGRIFALEEHLERFANSLTAIGINNINVNQIRQKVQNAFEKSKIDDAKIYFHITRGSGPRNHNWADDIEPNFFLTITEITDEPKLKAEGISVSIHPDWRWRRCDIKSLNLLANVLARQDAAKKGCYEAILVDENGLITEGAGSSFFAIFEKCLQTAPLTANILPSITRKYVIKAAEKINLEVIEKSMTVTKAKTADELFLAVTTRDIIPIVKFDDKIIGDSRPCKLTKELIQQFPSFTKC
jgi:D-alanine transaminase